MSSSRFLRSERFCVGQNLKWKIGVGKKIIRPGIHSSYFVIVFYLIDTIIIVSHKDLNILIFISLMMHADTWDQHSDLVLWCVICVCRGLDWLWIKWMTASWLVFIFLFFWYYTHTRSYTPLPRPRLPLNEDPSWNIKVISVQAAVFQPLRSPLNEDKLWNIPLILVQAAVFQPLRSPLNEDAL